MTRDDVKAELASIKSTREPPSRHARHAPVLLAAFAGLLCACTGRVEVEDSTPPPIILLDIDTLRADHLGCYGYERDTSPNLDALAEESVRFEWAFSQAPNTAPSQASILSGLYPTTHGMIEDEDHIPEEVSTLAEVLAEHGYLTAAFVDGGFMRAHFGFDQGFGLYEDKHGPGGLAHIGPKAVKWVEEHADESFLLLVHTYDVHTPYDPPEPYRSMFLDGLEPPTPGFEPTVEEMESIRLSVWTDEPRTLAANDLAYAEALYDAGIRYVDDWIGGFLERLRELDLYDEAILVVFSDHGEEFQEHGSVLHSKLYATVTHIPLLIRLPGGRHSGTVRGIVEGVDLMPTLLELAGAEVPHAVQGESLIPHMRGEEVAADPGFGESPWFGRRRFVAHGDHRLLLSKRNGTLELYEFRADPAEQMDLSGELPQLVEELRVRIHAWEELCEQAAFATGEAQELSEELRAELEALGYAE